MLEHSKTLELLELAQKGDEDAKSILLKENSPLIKSVIKPYRNRGIEYDDLYQLGSLGFIKAISGFKASFGVKFSTYCVPMVAGEVKRFLRDDGSIKISRALKSLNVQINKYSQEYQQKYNQSPTIEHLAKQFCVEEQEIIFALDCRKTLLSLDEKQDDDTRSRSLIDTIEEPDKTETMLDNIVLKNLIKDLPTRDKQLIAMRFFQDKTQTEIAERLGVSQVQVSRLENKILSYLKSKFS